ncbi:dihydropteroate synthase [Ruminococcus flavefaciens]|uniref:Dihydropteroate synthase n=1 Tax=Ruminococcus flavefaciens 007c TaxID=1341157 RepID=W7UVE5_RUMFL|nr:dihydropteroate synthase [Ruminococcus flavefaciens]EWM52292.1 dihydropteroate synthase [Ruminococcus flavefaciens 007c]
MIIGKYRFAPYERCRIIGILNVTPDSFSDGGRFDRIDKALEHTEQMIAEGMDIVDIGGESTRPGYTMISAEEETERVVPVIEAIKQRFDIPVSLDTYKYKVAEAGIAAGADLINDIWGLRYDSGEMAELIARTGAACCLMHNRDNSDYKSFMEDMTADMRITLGIAEKAGISPDRIIIDPGVGFGKTYENNLEAIDRLDVFGRELGFPVLLGASRKSVIGLTLDLPANERLEGTLAITVAGVLKGASFIRVHDIKENVRAVKMTEAIMRGYSNG